MYQIVLEGSLLLEMPEFMTLNGQKKTQKNPHKIWKVIIGKNMETNFISTTIQVEFLVLMVLI